MKKNGSLVKIQGLLFFILLSFLISSFSWAGGDEENGPPFIVGGEVGKSFEISSNKDLDKLILSGEYEVASSPSFIATRQYFNKNEVAPPTIPWSQFFNDVLKGFDDGGTYVLLKKLHETKGENDLVKKLPSISDVNRDRSLIAKNRQRILFLAYLFLY